MDLLDSIKSWLHRKEAEKFTTDAAGKTAVRVKGDLTIIGASPTEDKKNTLLDASDLVKTYTYTSISNVDVVTEIIFTSVATDAFYSETIDLTRTITYVANKPPTMNTVTDVFTVV